MRIHHAAVHGESIAKVEKRCEVCDGEFEVYRSAAPRRVCCSVECAEHHSLHASEAWAQLPLASDNGAYRKAIVEAIGGFDDARAAVDETASCRQCGRSGDGVTIVLHHIVPVFAGGGNVDALLMPLCDSCHKRVERTTKEIPEVEPYLHPPALE